MRRLKYIETDTMKIVMCDCGRITGIDTSVLRISKTDYIICSECKKEINIRKYFKDLMPKEVK